VRRLLLISWFAFFCGAQATPPIPPEVKFKTRYVNPSPKPQGFTSAMLWGIAIADTRVPGYERARVEVATTRLTCRVDGKEIVLNDDSGNVRGGLYRRYPWFGTDAHGPMPLAHPVDHSSVILAVGSRPDRVWHFWAASPRAAIPPGKLEGCTVKVRNEFRVVRCYKLASTIGGTLLSDTERVQTITKRAQASGICRQSSGRRQSLRTSVHWLARNSKLCPNRILFRLRLFAVPRAGGLPVPCET